MNDRILEGLKILLVEEEILIAMDIEQLCYDHGAAAVTTLSSQSDLKLEALETGSGKGGTLDIDAAVLDVKVGEGLTAELAHRLTRGGIPFIFATGYSRVEPFFAEFPEISVVAKPFEGTELVEALGAAVRRARSGNGG